MMNWTKLLSKKRFNTKDSGAQDRPESPFLLDLDRITFSSYFRRLQDKTQVHPLSEGGRVRSRLTHSIEVASVGRTLGYHVGCAIAARPEIDISAHDFGYIVQAACLAHDIGNPPFGHAGEAAIGDWFAHNQQRLFDDHMSEAEKADFLNFEGNAQGFRILNSLDVYRARGGFRLSFAALGAFTKYPRASTLAQHVKGSVVGDKKAGFCQAEAMRFQELADELGLIKRSDADDLWARHPLAFLMEAADDICYSVADLEDGVAMGCINFADVEAQLAPIVWGNEGPKPFYQDYDEAAKLGYLRGMAIRTLVEAAGKAFLDNEQALLAGTFNSELLQATPYGPAVKACKEFATKAIFETYRKTTLEIAGFEVLESLLDLFATAVLDWEDKGGDVRQIAARSQRVLKLIEPTLPPQPGTRYENLLLVSDFISGLSDHNALTLYKRIKGLNL